jgi:DNA-directed RNA polymerase subunit H (RpoH/RPB5)
MVLQHKINPTTNVTIHIHYEKLQNQRVNEALIDGLSDTYFGTRTNTTEQQYSSLVTTESPKILVVVLYPALFEINEPTINHLKFLWENHKMNIILYTLKSLQFNVLLHALVPDHRILGRMRRPEEYATDADVDVDKYGCIHLGELNRKPYDPTELDGILIKYNVTIDQLPTISRFDPVAKAICINPGEVCEITRGSNTAITSKYYRLCVNSDFHM